MNLLSDTDTDIYNGGRQTAARIFPLVLFVIMLLMPLAALSQDADENKNPKVEKEVDSLLALITPDMPDSVKAAYYCMAAYETGNVDTCIKYSFKSLECCHDSTSILVADNTRYIAWGYWMKDNPMMALRYALHSTKIYTFHHDSSSLEHNYRLMSKLYDKLNKADSVNYCINKAMEINRLRNDTFHIAQCYIDLSEIYSNKHFYIESENCLREALRLDSLTNDSLEFARCYYRIGELYCTKAKTRAEYIATKDLLVKSINLFKETNTSDKFYISTMHLAYGDLANAYIKLAKDTKNDIYADSCYMYLKESLDYLLQQNRFENAIDVGYTYFEYFKYYKRYEEALAYLHRLQKYFDDKITKIKLRNYYDKLREAYFLVGDYKNAYECVLKQMEYNDDVINDSTMAALATLKTEQAMIKESYKRELAENLHYLQRRKLITTIILLCVVLTLICVLVFHISKNLRIRKQNNAILMLKNKMLNQQKAEILAQRDEIESQKNEIEIQKNIITDQWQEVENVNKNLIHSINYAQRIQRAAVSKIEEVRAIFPESFVFYRPRDIVSGDFYRCGRCGKYAVMITADCTGHGIPGAFLSMLGLSGLKEFMVSEYDAENPGTVLDRMRTFIKSTLISSQKGKIIDDGMDMTICCYDFEKMIMHYAIAAQTALIIRGGEAIKLKGDSMPVGHYVRESDHFQNMTIDIQKGDMIYTFSDGIQDQLGGADKRKYMLKNLTKYLINVATKPTDEQSQLLEQSISAWRGNTPQVDDMTLIGIRVI